MSIMGLGEVADGREESGGRKSFVDDAAIGSDLKCTCPLNRTLRQGYSRQRHARV